MGCDIVCHRSPHTHRLRHGQEARDSPILTSTALTLLVLVLRKWFAIVPEREVEVLAAD